MKILFYKRKYFFLHIKKVFSLFFICKKRIFIVKTNFNLLKKKYFFVRKKKYFHVWKSYFKHIRSMSPILYYFIKWIPQDEMDWFDHNYVTESSFYPIYY